MRDYRGRAANERLSQHRAVPGDPHDAQTSAVRPQSRAQSHISMSMASSKTVASTCVNDRARRSLCGSTNERLSQHRAVPGDPHDAQTSAVRPQSGVWALECTLALALRAIFSSLRAPKAIHINIFGSWANIQEALNTFFEPRCAAALSASLLAPDRLARRTSRATTKPRRHQRPRLCDGRRV